MFSLSKGIAAGAAAVALSALAAGGLAGTAQAAPASSPFQLCNYGFGDYVTWVSFPDRRGFVSPTFAPGECWNVGKAFHGEAFRLTVRHIRGTVRMTTSVDHANNGTTGVFTGGTFSSFSYTKQ